MALAVAIAMAHLPMTSAAFTARTSDVGNAFGSAASFCASPGNTTLTVTNDSTLRESDPSGNYGNATSLEVRSLAGDDRRIIVRPTLPTLPPHCTLQTAVMTFTVQSYKAGRTYQAYRVASNWSFNTVTWANQPAVVGSPTTAATTSGTWTIDVLPLVKASMSAGTNYGVLIRDSVENAATEQTNRYDSLDATTPAVVAYTWA
jgi:hypothetical protein